MTGASRVMGLFALALILLLPTQASAAAKPDLTLKLDEYSLNLKSYCFPSGLRVVFQEDHTQPIVSFTMVIDKGSADDPVGQEGLAHLVEHLWFRSRHGEAPKVWDMLQEMGANLNATTASDVTTYMTIAPKDMLAPLMRLEALRLDNALSGVDAETVGLEREIVRNELRMRYENGGGSFLQFVREALYPPTHPYARLGIGSHDSITGLSLEMAQAFVDTHYTPSNATLMVVGDFTLEEAASAFTQTWPKAYMADPKNPEAPVTLAECPVRVSGPSEEPPAPPDQSLKRYKGNLKEPLLVLAWSMPGAYREDETLNRLTASAVGLGLSQAINRRVGYSAAADERNGAGCFLISEEIASTALCTIQVGRGQDPDQLYRAAVDSLYKNWSPEFRDIQQAGFNKSLAQQMLSTFLSVEDFASLSGRGSTTANHIHFTGDAAYFSTTFKRLSETEPFDIANVASKYLNRDRVVAVLIEPYEEGEAKVDASEGGYAGRPRESAVETAVPIEKLGPEYIRRLAKPPQFQKVKAFALPNGLNVVLYPHGEAPIARAMLAFQGGDLTEPVKGLDGLAWNAAEIPVDLEDAPFRMAGRWYFERGSNSQYFGITGSSANLDGMLYLLREAVTNEEIELKSSGKKLTEQGIKGLHRAREEAGYWSRVEPMRRLLPDHPAAEFMTEASYEALGKVKKKELEAWHDRVYRPENATLIVVGKIDPAKTESVINAYFADWTVKAKAEPIPPPPGAPALPDQQVLVFDDKNETQTRVSLSCPLAPASFETIPAADVLESVLSEMAWVALRETSGVSYGAGASARALPGGAHYLTMSSLVQNNAAALATQTLLDISRRATEGDLSADLITVSKAQIARGYTLRQQTSAGMMSRFLNPISLGGDWMNIVSYPSTLANIGLEDLKAVSAPCAGHEVVSLTGPVAVIKPQLEAAGISFEVFDWEAEAARLWKAQDPKGYESEQERKAKLKEKEEKIKADAKKASTGEDAKKASEDAKKASEDAKKGGADEGGK